MERGGIIFGGRKRVEEIKGGRDMLGNEEQRDCSTFLDVILC